VLTTGLHDLVDLIELLGDTLKEILTWSQEPPRAPSLKLLEAIRQP
jgi:hypothetical protein